jgi:trigger factor
MVSEELENIRKSYGENVSVEQSEAEDIIQGVLIEEALDIENEITISIQQVEKKEQKKFIGKKSGDSITFNLTKAIKDTAHQARLLDKTEEELAESKLNGVTLNVKEIKRMEPAELNQEFFDKLFGKDQVKTQKDLKEKIKEYLSSSFQRETENFLTHSIREEILRATKMNLPDDKDYQNYAKEMKWKLILNRIADDNEVKVENEEVVSKAKELIVSQLASSGIGDQMADQLDAFADNYLKGNEGQNYLQVFNQVRNDKIMDLIRDKISIAKKDVSLEQFKKAATR